MSKPGLERRYSEVEPALRRLGADLPRHLLPDAPMHLDPDFENLTYGDCTPRGNPIRRLQQGDFLAFYASLMPIKPPYKLVYALIGFYEIAEIAVCDQVPEQRWRENAHTRRNDHGDDVIVRAKPEKSGRLKRCLPIGEYRNRSYRVRRDILDRLGAIAAKDGFIQRSGSLPAFVDPPGFLRWFERQQPALERRN